MRDEPPVQPVTKPVAEDRQTTGPIPAALRIVEVEAPLDQPIPMGEDVEVKALVELGALTVNDVVVELYHGPADPDGKVIGGTPIRLVPTGEQRGEAYVFAGRSPCDFAGRHAFTMRVMPQRPGMLHPMETGHIKWW